MSRNAGLPTLFLCASLLAGGHVARAQLVRFADDGEQPGTATATQYSAGLATTAATNRPVVFAPPPPSTAPGAPPSLGPDIPAAEAPALGSPGALPPSSPSPYLSPFGQSLNNWGEPQGQIPGPESSDQWNATLQGGGPYAVPAPGTCGGCCQNCPPGVGFLHGGLFRMFLYGNGSASASNATGAYRLWAGFFDWAPPVAEPMPCVGLYGFQGYELWRQIPDGNTRPNGNNGVTQGLNVATGVPWLDQYGIGAQLGMSYGAFNFSPNTVQQQFVTVGFFRRATADRPLSFGMVYDWMIAQGFGAYSQSMTLGQFRAQIAYAFAARDEVGIWGTFRNGQVDKFDPMTGAPLQYRAISQGNLFWHHKFGPGGADVWVWTGFPSFYRLGNAGPGTPTNDFETNIFGYRLNQPLTDWVDLYSTFQAMHPTGGASTHTVYDFIVGLSYYAGGASRSRTVAGRTWMPYMPVANNGSFLVDTNQTF